MNKVSIKLRAAMERKNVPPDKIDKIIHSITSFALYGFPESHAISFAILAYASAYLKVHRAPEFYASLLNNQPMGFYTSATIVKDAHRHGIKMKPVCVAHSSWDCTVLSDDTVRLGFCVVNGLRQEHVEKLISARQERKFASIEDFKRRVLFSREGLRTLAELGALNCFAEHRRAAMWRVEETVHDDLLGSARVSRVGESVPLSPAFERRFRWDTETNTRDACAPQNTKSPLKPMTMPERVKTDYDTMDLTT